MISGLLARPRIRFRSPVAVVEPSIRQSDLPTARKVHKGRCCDRLSGIVAFGVGLVCECYAVTPGGRSLHNPVDALVHDRRRTGSLDSVFASIAVFAQDVDAPEKGGRHANESSRCVEREKAGKARHQSWR